MEYVVVEISGKQYRVAAGDVIEVDRINGASGSVVFDKVLLSVAGDDMQLGKPYVDGVSVSAKILENFKGNKVRVSRFTAKSRHRRVIGFRASLSKVEIEKINSGTKKTSKSAADKKVTKITAKK